MSESKRPANSRSSLLRTIDERKEGGTSSTVYNYVYHNDVSLPKTTSFIGPNPPEPGTFNSKGEKWGVYLEKSNYTKLDHLRLCNWVTQVRGLYGMKSGASPKVSDALIMQDVNDFDELKTFYMGSLISAAFTKAFEFTQTLFEDKDYLEQDWVLGINQRIKPETHGIIPSTRDNHLFSNFALLVSRYVMLNITLSAKKIQRQNVNIYLGAINKIKQDMKKEADKGIRLF